MNAQITVAAARGSITGFLLAIGSLTATALPAQQHFATTEDLQVMLDYLVEDQETPGIVLGIVEADGSTRVLSSGTAGPGTRPLGTRSIFEIGSINKTMTGVLLADMVLRGEVALEDPVAKYLPAGVTVPTRNGREITLVDLATHFSGLPRLADNHTPADPENPYNDYTIETLYEFLSNHTLRRDIGSEYEYSNLGFGLLGHTLARAAGTSYRDLLRERVLEPLDMEMSGWALEGERWAWSTRGHSRGEVTPYWTGSEAINGAGGLRSNLDEMLLYLKASMGLVETELAEAMQLAMTPRRSINDDVSIGLGWQVVREGDRTLHVHGGGTGGFSTYLGFDRDLGVGFVRLANTGNFQDDVGRDFLVRGPPTPVADVAVSPTVLASYAGTYEGSGETLHIRLEEDGTLTLQNPPNVRFRLYADSETEFVTRRTPWRVRFNRDAAGQVTSLTMSVQGQQVEAARTGPETPPPAQAAGNVIESVPLAADEMARYVGSYTLSMGPRTMGVRIFVDDDVLIGQPEGQSATRLIYQGDHTFVPEADPSARIVFMVEGGQVTGIALRQGGQEIPGTRDR